MEVFITYVEGKYAATIVHRAREKDKNATAKSVHSAQGAKMEFQGRLWLTQQTLKQSTNVS